MSKRLFDLAVSLSGALVISPLFVILAFIVWFQLRRPVFFRQARIGLDERPFTIWKFRSMLNLKDAHGRLLPDEARLSAFGRFLRRSSLDELPQLINVIVGEMSLVGPRPLLPEYLSRYSAGQRPRHRVKPGITGWAQVNGRNALTWEEKFALDVWYVDHRSFLLDLRIVWLTLLTAVRRDGISRAGHATMPEFLGNRQ